MENLSENIKVEDGKIGAFYAVHIHNGDFDKLLVIQTYPEHKIWFKDKEISTDKLIEILSKAE